MGKEGGGGNFLIDPSIRPYSSALFLGSSLTFSQRKKDTSQTHAHSWGNREASGMKLTSPNPPSQRTSTSHGSATAGQAPLTTLVKHAGPRCGAYIYSLVQSESIFLTLCYGEALVMGPKGSPRNYVQVLWASKYRLCTTCIRVYTALQADIGGVPFPSWFLCAPAWQFDLWRDGMKQFGFSIKPAKVDGPLAIGLGTTESEGYVQAF